jgi:hypothetical protein
MEKNNKQKHEQPWTLTYILVLQTMSFPLSSFFFWFQTNWFSFQNDVMYAKSQMELYWSWTFV